MALTDRVRIVNIPESCGCTLTAATITGLTPARLEAMSTTELALARVISESVEARTVGVVARPLHELLMSRVKEVGKDEIQQKKVGRQSIILPFTYRRRKTNLASDYFNIASGAANANAGTTTGGITYPVSAWDIVVNVGPSSLASSLTGIEKYFLPGQYLFVENSDAEAAAGSQTAYATAYKIIKSVAGATDGFGRATATITIAPNYTDAAFTALSTPQKTVLRPELGVVQIGTNNVSDYESWCHNEVAEKNGSLLVDWHQTSRYTQCHNDEYDRILSQIMSGNVNEYLKEFQYLPLAEQNKKQRLQYENKWMRSVFYGQAITEKQSVETYDQLPQVVDPDDGCVYEYKANALGMRTLLAQESRVYDMGGGSLDLDLLFQIAYDIKRNREVDGENVTVVDFMTDKDTGHLIDLVLTKHLKDLYGYNVTKFFEQGQVKDDSGFVRFTYNKYDVPGWGLQIAIFVDNFFTDRVTQFGDGTGGVQGDVNLRSRGRALWAIDWSDFDIGIVGTNQAKREYRGETFANVNPLFSCVITPNTKHYELRSTTWTVRLGDAKRHAVIENFSTECPTVTVPACAPGYSA